MQCNIKIEMIDGSCACMHAHLMHAIASGKGALTSEKGALLAAIRIGSTYPNEHILLGM